MIESTTESSKAWSAGLSGDITPLLRACAVTVDRVGPSEWRLVGDNPAVITARCESGWLVLHTSIRPEADWDAAQPWSVLSRNGGLPGVKYSVAPNERGIELRAEIPLDGEVEARVRQAVRLMWQEEGPHSQRNETEASAESGDASADLEQLCTDAGWAFTARPDGSLAVELRAPDAYGVARVAGCAGGAVQASIDVVNEAEAVSPVCRAALAVFMLRVNDAVRFVRVVAPPSENETILGLEVVFPTPPSAAEVDHALAALSVAWGMCSREAEVLLRDEIVAQAYLDRSPWLLVPGP